jgi:8-oxo-dGTP pyrophosphatase MutT (NUDIX family)
MGKAHRIAAGGLIFKGNTVLLVKYKDSQSPQTFLVGPGGKLEDDENLLQAIIRETKEETGVTVKPIQVAAIEDLLTDQYKMIKVWMLCDTVKGEIRRTEEAEKEGIVDAGWFTREQLAGEVVFPTLLLERDWELLQAGTDPVVCYPSRVARF